jgi:hypothetical protein
LLDFIGFAMRGAVYLKGLSEKSAILTELQQRGIWELFTFSMKLIQADMGLAIITE